MPDESAPIRAPELTGAVDWLNVDAPLTLADLRGKVVLLDFWTYGCVNCMHLLPGLARLEAKYRDALVVIGVHSAKFANERDSGNLRLILERYGITHPVANDAELKVWREYTVRAWPTLVLIDPAGYIVAGASGEGHLDAFDEAIAAVIQVFSDKGELDPTPTPGDGSSDAGRDDASVSRQGRGRSRRAPPLHRRFQPPPYRRGLGDRRAVRRRRR